jgi:LysM repeat protein
MARMKRGSIVASTLLLIAILVSACNQPYSQPPAVTNTPVDPSSLFATALTEPAGMNNVENFSTQTALAGQTPVPGFVTETPSGILQSATGTSTPLVALIPTNTPTATLAVGGATAVSGSTAAPSGPRPAIYTLQNGEFPYCIARRFNVDPDELLSLNGITGGDIYYSGFTLKIPQTGNPFPGARALRNHPATYTVTSSSETLYSIACVFGDVDPSAIATANGISVASALSSGQQLSIP